MVNGWSRLNRMESNRTNEPAIRVAKLNPRTNDANYNNSQSCVVNQLTSNNDHSETTDNDPRQNYYDRNKLPDNLKHTKNVSLSLHKQEKIDVAHYDQAVKVEKEIVAKNKRKSNSDTYSKISSANVLDAKTRQPYNGDPGVQTSNFKKDERHKD